MWCYSCTYRRYLHGVYWNHSYSIPLLGLPAHAIHGGAQGSIYFNYIYILSVTSGVLICNSQHSVQSDVPVDVKSHSPWLFFSRRIDKSYVYGLMIFQDQNPIWLVVSTPLKNISQWEGLSHIFWKIKHV